MSGVKRMLRIVWNGLAIVSVLLLVTTISLWVRTYHKADEFSEKDRLSGWVATMANGHLAITWYRGDRVNQMMPQRFSHRRVPANYFDAYARPFTNPGATAGYDLKWAGFQIAYLASGLKYHQVCAPFWFIALSSAIPLPIRWLYLRRHRNVVKFENRCNACGYDLRATPDRCPECGAVPAGKIKISN